MVFTMKQLWLTAIIEKISGRVAVGCDGLPYRIMRGMFM
jgi:hypothetical protein